MIFQFKKINKDHLGLICSYFDIWWYDNNIPKPIDSLYCSTLNTAKLLKHDLGHLEAGTTYILINCSVFNTFLGAAAVAPLRCSTCNSLFLNNPYHCCRLPWWFGISHPRRVRCLLLLLHLRSSSHRRLPHFHSAYCSRCCCSLSI